MPTHLPRLDAMLYAHDGRGLGHVSRSAAIGMALRRLYPELRVLLVTGAAQTRELIGDNTLDWLKLPAYATEVVAGVSRGVTGQSNFTDKELGELRSSQLLQLVELYRPRLVLTDHSPQGKHRELLAASGQSSACQGGETRWVLGVRGVVGEVAQLGSGVANSTFKKYYQELLWYGDSVVLGDEHLKKLEEFYQTVPYECGYVARMKECVPDTVGTGKRPGLAATVSIPWLGEKTFHAVEQLARVIKVLGGEYGVWNIFGDVETVTFFDAIPHCRTFAFSGPAYVNSLIASKMAVIFGGYNSIVDVLSLDIPALVFRREMADREQQIHLERLERNIRGRISSMDESEVAAEVLEKVLRCNLQLTTRDSVMAAGVPDIDLHQKGVGINLQGAGNAARRLHKILKS